MNAWGKLWGCSDDEPMYVDEYRRGYWLRRKGCRCRFYDVLGVQYGPEHTNVVPALVWAVMHGLSDPRDPIGTMLMREEIERNTIKPERRAS